MISREVSQSGKINRSNEETEVKGKVSNRKLSYSSSPSLTILMMTQSRTFSDNTYDDPKPLELKGKSKSEAEVTFPTFPYTPVAVPFEGCARSMSTKLMLKQ
ncbi:MAG: hypothetical protein F6K65_09015 [Moorea sp. SIO3C2]|nr:hypothetical protein [Moorena sp. SIO3C2]